MRHTSSLVLPAAFGLYAAGRLFDEAKPNPARLSVGAAIAMTYLLFNVARVPRTLNSLATSVFHPPAAHSFEQRDFAAFAATMKNPLTLRAKIPARPSEPVVGTIITTWIARLAQEGTSIPARPASRGNLTCTQKDKITPQPPQRYAGRST
jgi:hypothetical protein